VKKGKTASIITSKGEGKKPDNSPIEGELMYSIAGKKTRMPSLLGEKKEPKIPSS